MVQSIGSIVHAETLLRVMDCYHNESHLTKSSNKQTKLGQLNLAVNLINFMT